MTTNPDLRAVHMIYLILILCFVSSPSRDAVTPESGTPAGLQKFVFPAAPTFLSTSRPKHAWLIRSSCPRGRVFYLNKMGDDSGRATLSPASASHHSKLQLPASCDPPGPQNPQRQLVWVVCPPALLDYRIKQLRVVLTSCYRSSEPQVISAALSSKPPSPTATLSRP